MSRPIDDHSLDQLFREARSHGAWTDRPVTEVDLRAIYELTKLGATSANCSPARFVWVTSDEGKKKLQPLVSATLGSANQSLAVGAWGNRRGSSCAKSIS